MAERGREFVAAFGALLRARRLPPLFCEAWTFGACLALAAAAAAALPAPPPAAPGGAAPGAAAPPASSSPRRAECAAQRPLCCAAVN